MYQPYRSPTSGLWFYGNVRSSLTSPVGYCAQEYLLQSGGHPTPEAAEACFALYLAKEQTQLGAFLPGGTVACEDEIHSSLARRLVREHPILFGWLPPGTQEVALVLKREPIRLCSRHMNAPAVMAALLRRGLENVMEGR